MKKIIIWAAAIFLAVTVSNVDATMIISTNSTGMLGGLTFQDGHLVGYDLPTNSLTLLLDEALFDRNADIDAVSILDNGNVILSTKYDSSLGGLDYFNIPL